MSREIGQKIAIKFTEGLVDFEETPQEGYPELMINTGTITASDYYSSYLPSNAFDNNTSSYWRTNDSLPQWIKIQFDKPIAVYKFKWYVSSYRPELFELQGSNNDVDWATIYTGNSPNATGWHTFEFKPKGEYVYYRWNILSKYSSYVYIYEIELYYKEFKNELAFDVIGKEYKHVNGELIDGDYRIESITTHPTELKTMLLTLNPLNRFNNVEGNLTVKYNAAKGNLKGTGGVVNSFEIPFTPTDLEPKPNPYAIEKINVSGDFKADFIRIYYSNGYNEEKIAPSLGNLTVTFTFVGVVNP